MIARYAHPLIRVIFNDALLVNDHDTLLPV